MSPRARVLTALLAAVLALAACSGGDSGVPRRPAVTEVAVEGCDPVEARESSGTIAPVAVLTGEGACPVEVEAWGWCGPGACVDGTYDEESLPVLSTEAVTLTVAGEGWDFETTHVMPGPEHCRRRMSLDAPATGDATFDLPAAGPSGRRVVTMFGRDGRGSDAIYAFVWKAPHEGAYPAAASGQATVLADNDGQLTSYGVGLGLADLAGRPRSASAQIVVRDAGGGSARIPLDWRRRCTDLGSESFEGGSGASAEATQLGPGPFTYEVELVLDGQRYTGTATWPDDTTPEITPSVPLVWDPPLPGYAG